MKKKLILLLLVATTIVGCGKTTENKKDDTKENVKVELNDEKKAEIIKKIKEREIRKIKAETRKTLFSKFTKIFSDNYNGNFIVEYNTDVDAITALATGETKEEVMKSIKSDTDESLKKVNDDLKNYDLTQFFNGLQFYFLNPEKPDTVAFIYKDSQIKKVNDELKISAEKIEGEDKVTPETLSADEIKQIQAETKKESLANFLENFQKEVGDGLKVEYNTKLDAITMTPSGDAKEGLMAMLENKNSQEVQVLWEESKGQFIFSAKALDEFFSDITVNIMGPDGDKVLLSIKNGEAIEDNFLK